MLYYDSRNVSYGLCLWLSMTDEGMLFDNLGFAYFKFSVKYVNSEFFKLPIIAH